MNVLELWVRTPAAEGLGWALAHSVWQGAVAALVVAATRSARTRYAVACSALAAMFTAFVATWLWSIPEAAMRGVLSPPTLLRVPDSLGAAPFQSPSTSLAVILPWLAPFWAAGVLVFHARALAGWRAARRLRTVGVCAPPEYWRECLVRLAERLRVSRTVLLLESGLSRTPVVVGHLRPVILLPAGILTGLSPDQVEAVLLHELAHIRRHDYLVNVLQTWVESILFYHPAVWWISTVIRAEREHCCDDLAAAAQGDAHRYAAALVALERYRWSAEPAVAATGGDLVKRIRRLLDYPEAPRAAFAPVVSAIVLTLAVTAALAAWQAPQPAPVSPYTKWVQEDVAYLISDRERAAFLALTSDEEREKFIEQFWERRDPTPGTVANEMKEEHYRRIAYSNERFGDGKVAGWKTDRGRIYILYGPPDQLEKHPKGDWPDAAPATESWLYKALPDARSPVVFKFTDGGPVTRMFLIRP